MPLIFFLSAECSQYLDLDLSAPIVRHYATVHLDAVLRATGPGVQAGAYAEAEVQ